MSAPPLAFFLFDAEERIVNETTERLRESPLDHYRQMETIDLRPRMEAHFAAYREAILSGDGTIFASYVADIGRKRLQQGYGLEELLFVLDTLFETVWETAAEAWRDRGTEAFDDLRRLAQGVSWGKDRLATVYAEESKKERAALRRLSFAFDEYLRLRKTSGSEGAAEKKRGTP